MKNFFWPFQALFQFTFSIGCSFLRLELASAFASGMGTMATICWLWESQKNYD